MDLKEKALAMHKEWNGKLETIAKSKVNSRENHVKSLQKIKKQPTLIP